MAQVITVKGLQGEGEAGLSAHQALSAGSPERHSLVETLNSAGCGG
jgi:hypothetical protein